MSVGCDFLNVHACSHGEIRCKGNLAVFVTVGGFHKSVLGNNLAVLGGHILSRIQAKLHLADFTVITDAEKLVSFKVLCKVDFYLLSLIDKGGRGACYGNFLSGIHKLHVNLFTVKHHSKRRCDFGNLILSEVEFTAFGSSVSFGCNGINNLALCITECAVKGHNILGCGNFIYRTCKTLDFVNRLIHAVLLGNGGKDLALLGNGNRAFLCIVQLFHDHKVACAVHLKVHGSSIKDVFARSGNGFFDNLIIAVRERVREHQHTRFIGVVHLNVHGGRIVDTLYHKFARVGVQHLKTNTRRRDNLARFRILFHDLNVGLKHSIIDNKAIDFLVCINADLKGG